MRKVFGLVPDQFHPFDILKHDLDKTNSVSGLASAAMEFGHEYEPIAAQIYAQHERASLAKVGIIEHPLHRWLACSPDRIDVTNNKLVEIKCAYSRVLPSVTVPPAHWTQMQIAMACSGIHTCAYVECSVANHTRRESDDIADYVIFTRDISFDVHWFESVVRDLYKFHQTLCTKLGRGPAIFCHQGVHPPPSDINNTFYVNGNKTACVRLNADGSKVSDDIDNMLTSLWNLPATEHMDTYLPPLEMPDPSNDVPMHNAPSPSQEHFMPVQVESTPAQDQSDNWEPQSNHVRNITVQPEHGLFTNLYGRRFE